MPVVSTSRRKKSSSSGIGVGGHCIPIDPWFIKEVDPSNSRLIFASRLINDEMPARVAAHQGHQVVGLGGERVRHLDDLMALVGGDAVGQETAVRVLRGGSLTEVTVVIGERE
mgnify:CR=1 FL=1